MLIKFQLGLNKIINTNRVRVILLVSLQPNDFKRKTAFIRHKFNDSNLKGGEGEDNNAFSTE